MRVNGIILFQARSRSLYTTQYANRWERRRLNKIMRVGRRKRGGSKKVKVPHIEFNLDSIKEIKKRKKRSKERR